MFRGLLRHKQVNRSPSASGIRIYLLQDRAKRFTTEELNKAMQAAWHRPYDPVTFFATAIDSQGALLKMGDAYYPIIYSDYPLASEHLGELEVPLWAGHHATTRFSAEFPGGVGSEQAPQLYWLLGVIIAQLASSSTKALFFQEAGVFVALTPELLVRLNTPVAFTPQQLLA
jgi:hypothetical protein